MGSSQCRSITGHLHWHVFLAFCSLLEGHLKHKDHKIEITFSSILVKFPFHCMQYLFLFEQWVELLCFIIVNYN